MPLYAKSTPRPTVDYLDVIEILDKYNDILDYKSAWEELLYLYENKLKDTYSKNDVMVLGILKKLKEKYDLGGE